MSLTRFGNSEDLTAKRYRLNGNEPPRRKLEPSVRRGIKPDFRINADAL
jgi:hypothetical protein